MESFRFTNKMLDTFGENGEGGKIVRVHYDWSRWLVWFRQIGVMAWVETEDGHSWIMREGKDATDERVRESTSRRPEGVLA